MGRLGMGFPAGRRRNPNSQVAEPPAQISEISPSASWTGVEGSGFTALPADPLRSTAKPMIRPLFVPRQRYTDELTIGVAAGANDNGSLYANLGLQKVIVHFEGNTVELTNPSVQTFPDANGVQRSYIGWWVTLKHSGLDGKADVYFEAVPNDNTMQNRVIGPFTMHPAAQLYDYEIEIAPSLPQITGQRYPSFNLMRAYLKGENADTALVTISEAGDYDLHLGAFSSDWNRGSDVGWLTITASAPVRIKTPLDSNGLPSIFRPRIEPVCWRGSNITFDFADTGEYYTEPSWGYENWFDGVAFTNGNGREDLVRGRPRDLVGQLVRGQNYLTECTFSSVWNAATSQLLVRGCSVDDCWGDLFGGTECVIGSSIDDFDSSWFRTGVAALQVQYSGSAGSATIRASGTTTTKTWVLTEGGVDIDTFQTLSTGGAYLAGTHYTVQNVADWINTHSGWNATVLDNSRAAYSLGLEDGLPGGPFAAINAKGSPLTFYTRFDIHADIYQKGDGALKENVVIWGVAGHQIVAQDIFLTGTPGMNDVLVANCAFHNKDGDGQVSQFNAVHSHVVLAHISSSQQQWWMRTDLSYDGDGYCLIANNALPSISWEGAADGDVPITGNHLQVGATAPAGSTWTSTGGDGGSQFVNAAIGNFAPAGELAANPKAAVIAFDLNNNVRAASAPAGAVA